MAHSPKLIILCTAGLLVLPACNARETLGEVGPGSEVRRDVEGFHAVVTTRGTARGVGLAFTGPGDVDDDGFDDLIVAYGHEDATSVCLFLGGVDVAESLAESSADACTRVSHGPQDDTLSWPVRPLALGDINGDSIADFGAWVGPYAERAQLRVFRGAPGRSGGPLEVDAVLELGVGADGGWVLPTRPADIDGDGLSDLLVRSTERAGAPELFELRAFPGADMMAAIADGSASLPPPTVVATAPQPFVVDSGKFGASAAESLVAGAGWTDPTPPFEGFSVVQGRQGRFVPLSLPQSLSEDVTTEPAILLGAAVDWDCDGRDELVGPIRNRGNVLAFFDQDDGAPLPQRHMHELEVPRSIQAVFAVGDVDGDGCEDLVAESARPVNRSAMVLIYGGEQPAAAGDLLLSYGPTSWVERDTVQAIGDFDGDGHGDAVAAFSGNHVEYPLGEDDFVERLVLMYGGPRKVE